MRKTSLISKIHSAEFLWDLNTWGWVIENIGLSCDCISKNTTVGGCLYFAPPLLNSSAIIEFADNEFEKIYQFNNLIFIRKDQWSVVERKKIEDSLQLIFKNNDLNTIFNKIVKSIHPLTAEDGYDVSYSDPDLQFNIFVSIPKSHERNITLRLAEGILHECMHLYLSFINEKIPLVLDKNAYYFSPWKNTNRPVYGVIHGMFVFAVIFQWLKHYANDDDYVKNRMDEIKINFSNMQGLIDINCLTQIGNAIAKKCLDIVLGY